MTSLRPARVCVVYLIAALVASALVAPAALAKKKAMKCPAFTSGVEGAEEAELAKITPAATEEKPVVIEYEHGPSLTVVSQEDLYFNLQVYAPGAPGLYIRQEFDNQSDIDLYLYDEAGEEVASSGAFNPAPIPGATDADGNGGMGFESINGFAASSCAGYTIESSAYGTFGTPVTLKIWLGEPAAE